MLHFFIISAAGGNHPYGWHIPFALLVSPLTTAPLRGSVDQTFERLARIIPTLVGHCYPPFLGGGAQTLHLPTFRAIASCAGGHQIPLESSPFDGLILSYVNGIVKGFCSEVRQRYRGDRAYCILTSV